jgi:uncharacterized damage-inducible protein DinB
MPDVIDELLERNAQARAELMEAVDALTAEQRRIEWYGDAPWSVHDVVAHIVRWQDGFAHALELMARGERPRIPEFEGGGDFDPFNAESARRGRERSWEQLMSDARAARERHDAAVRGLRGAVDPERIVPGRTAYDLADTAEHDREHAADILAWRREQGF